MLVQEEVRLKNQGTHSINFVSIKELERNMLKENRGTIMLMSPPLKYIIRNIRIISVNSVENMDTFRKMF